MTSWHSYPKIFNLGHKAVRGLFDGEVIVEEKVDGSQFSFGLFDGELRMKSKNQEFTEHNAPTMFTQAAASVAAVKSELVDGWTYRGEYLSKPKHNTLAYERIPRGHIILFDINDMEESYLDYGTKRYCAKILGFETVPLLAQGAGINLLDLQEFMDNTSILGGQKIEGFVVKSINQYGDDKKLLMGKHVSEAFKEIHGGEWRKNNPPQPDLIAGLSARYSSPARYQKALIHLREQGVINGDPSDIGKLIPEFRRDLIEECADEIKDILWGHFRGRLERATVAGLPGWYKNLLLEQQFEGVA